MVLTVLARFNLQLTLLPLFVCCMVLSWTWKEELQMLGQLIRVDALQIWPSQMSEHILTAHFFLRCWDAVFRMSGLIRSGVECQDAAKGLRESFFKAMALSDRLGTCCQVKYRLELYESPSGQRAIVVMEKPLLPYVFLLQTRLTIQRLHVEYAITNQDQIGGLCVNW